MAIHVGVDRPFAGSPSADAASLMRGIRAGHFFTALDGVAGPPAFDFTASNDLGTVHEGDELGTSGPVTLRLASNAPASYTTIVHQGTQVITTVRDPQELVVHASAAPAVYWVEIVPPGARVPWLRSNPIYVRSAAPVTAGVARVPFTETVGLPAAGWRTEHDAASTATVDPAEHALRFALAPGAPGSQFAAFVIDTPDGIGGFGAIGFSARADRPMRVSVQLRSDEAAPDRWQRSVFVDRFDRDRTVLLDDVTPVGRTRSEKPPLDRIRAILFVVDLTNTKPGATGEFWIRSAALER
jgi:hypothetical protein